MSKSYQKNVYLFEICWTSGLAPNLEKTLNQRWRKTFLGILNKLEPGNQANSDLS